MKRFLLPALAALSLTPLAAAGAAQAETWFIYSYNGRDAYLADVDSIAQAEGETTVRVARISQTAAAGDYTHMEETYALKCADAQFSIVETVYYSRAGEVADRYKEDELWDGILPETTPAYLKQTACDEARSAQSFASIKAWVDAGRPTGAD